LGIKHYLTLIIEVCLYQFVVESEHDALIIFHPFFDINKRQILGFDRSCLTITSLKIFPEVLHQSDLFRQFFVIRTVRNVES